MWSTLFNTAHKNLTISHRSNLLMVFDHFSYYDKSSGRKAWPCHPISCSVAVLCALAPAVLVPSASVWAKNTQKVSTPVCIKLHKSDGWWQQGHALNIVSNISMLCDGKNGRRCSSLQDVTVDVPLRDARKFTDGAGHLPSAQLSRTEVIERW